MRPGDVIDSAKGLKVEIGNTDAEGRLILADALHLGALDAPDLLIDCATLTGAARAALGPDIAALFTDDDGFAGALMRHGAGLADPVWRLPLHAPYRFMLNSELADINNSAQGTMAGAITAALFLKEFVGGAKTWAHLDLYAWNNKRRSGRPVGGEATALRALYAVIAERYR
jgi:leucyl aminopeptidase